MRGSSLISTLVLFWIGSIEDQLLQLKKPTSLRLSTPLSTEALRLRLSPYMSMAKRSEWQHCHVLRQAVHAAPKAEVATSSSGSALTGQGDTTSPTERALRMSSEWQRCNPYTTKAFARCPASNQEFIVGRTGVYGAQLQVLSP